MTFDLSSGWAVLPWLMAALLILVWVRRQSGPAVDRSRLVTLWLLRGGVLVALVAIGLNPVRVSVTPGSIHRPEVHVLLDASQSMKLGSPDSRWHEATGQIGLDAVDHRGWQRFVVVTDSWGRRPQSASRGGAGTRCSASRWDMPPCLTRPRRARRSAPVRSALRAQSRQSENGGAAGAPRRV